jgi:glyoxylase-like metal-dependent hydrolase (beta-lactamase superfamily II)
MITTITIDNVNCYLVNTGEGFVLIDTGYAKSRSALEEALQKAGCQPGDLKLILITHGDFDHTGSGAYLREKYGVKIAMHRAEAGVVEFGDMLKARKIGERWLMRVMMSVLVVFMGGGRFERFTPDIFLEDSEDLSAYGFAARVLHIPGHSRGSIAFLTESGDLFCGDLLENSGAEKGKPPALNSLIDDLAVARASVEKLGALSIQTVFPGHGDPFPMEAFLEDYRKRQS